MLPRMVIGLVALMGLTAIALAYAPVPQPKPAKKPGPKELMKEIQGTWKIISTERVLNGRRTITKSASSTRIKIDGSTWGYIYSTAVNARPSTTYDLVFDFLATPARMELRRQNVVAIGGVAQIQQTPYMRGVIGLDGDKLKFCYVLGTRVGVNPPIKLSPDNGHYMMTLEKVKP